MGRQEAAGEAARRLILNPNLDLGILKRRISGEFGISPLRNSEILRALPKSKRKKFLELLRIRRTRTISGIAPIAVMARPYPCPGKCIYCPRGKEAPQSYTGREPAAMRAIQNEFDPHRQVASRLRQLEEIGHSVDKCELIVMGGTFNAQPLRYQRWFAKRCLDAMNGKNSGTLALAQKNNERAKVREIGMTIETRPDFAKKKQIKKMLELGATRIELGVQTLSDKVYMLVKRGHRVKDVIEATAHCKDAGLKVCYHMMPGLFVGPEEDAGMFARLFSDSDFRPDMLKIYPCMVLKGTKLYGMWKKGEYAPYDAETAAEVIARASAHFPPYVRVMRMQRDIPVQLIEAGVEKSNLRQLVEEKMRGRGDECRCIRCREMGLRNVRDFGGVELRRIEYEASGGREIFLSFESENGLAGFLRLRRPGKAWVTGTADAAIVRELHVYGESVPIGEKSMGRVQHSGYGKKLLEEAERIARDEWKMKKLLVLSGVGAREYYYKMGYSRDGFYAGKMLQQPKS
ncbi:MAG: tRNA uridine(34) 5-carboxymethylaminomethyl modification radical SAM/GNAT enzyme Elp3 [Candidatus Micrarchaeota archaeon]|nr:tRNA uridine(34) 5-carboxymethylaminomethyl modification radical SAM/GNAT enzyme Elp3 [Candidatus Micrarchaeota archaeon]